MAKTASTWKTIDSEPKKPYKDDLISIGFNIVRIYTRVYMVWGYKTTIQTKGVIKKEMRVIKDKNFIALLHDLY